VIAFAEQGSNWDSAFNRRDIHRFHFFASGYRVRNTSRTHFASRTPLRSLRNSGSTSVSQQLLSQHTGAHAPSFNLPPTINLPDGVLRC
jgi:hypothetical protein